MKLSHTFTSLLAATVLCAIATQAHAQDWGTIKGQIVYPGDAPKLEHLKVDKDEKDCLANGPLTSDLWVVNPKNHGLRWVMVFLKPAGSQQLPIHPALRVPAEKDVVIDQPMCKFEPHLIGIRDSQTLLAKNSSAIPHAIKVNGFLNDMNLSIPAGKDLRVSLVPEKNGIKLTCGLHSWMTGWCWCFAHPYFAVTDENGNFEIKNAPAGKWNLAVWHETGYSGGKEGAKGMPIEIKAGGVTDLGKITFAIAGTKPASSGSSK